MRFFGTMRAAMVATLLISASGMHSPKRRRVDSRRERVGFFIYGANLDFLPVSQDERIQAAFDYATGKVYAGKEHVYIVSGKNREATYMEEQLQDRYMEAGLQQPKIILETEARFTVDNVLKSLPLINNENLDRLCLVTSDYHMARACAIYDQFIKLGLCRYETYHEVPAIHRKDSWVDPRGELRNDEKFLERPLEGKCAGCRKTHKNVRAEIECTYRDGSNAGIFARYIRDVTDGRDLDDVQIDEPLIQEYLRNNKVSDEKLESYFTGFTNNVRTFVNTQPRWKRTL